MTITFTEVRTVTAVELVETSSGAELVATAALDPSVTRVLPKVATLYDPFDALDLDRWRVALGAPVVAGGFLSLWPGTDASVVTVDRFDFTDSELVVKVPAGSGAVRVAVGGGSFVVQGGIGD